MIYKEILAGLLRDYRTKKEKEYNDQGNYYFDEYDGPSDCVIFEKVLEKNDLQILTNEDYNSLVSDRQELYQIKNVFKKLNGEKL